VLQRRALPAEGLLADKVRVLARLDPAASTCAALVHRTDGDFPVAWAKTYGKGRVFYSTLGHAADAWDNPAVRQMYFEAIKWSLGLVDGDASPRPRASPVVAEPFDHSRLPNGEGQAAVLAMCGGCHGSPRPSPVPTHDPNGRPWWT
jgi:hypothetical protein